MHSDLHRYRKFDSESVDESDIVLLLSSVIVVALALVWYFRLYNYIIWCDEGGIYRATNNFITEGFPINCSMGASSIYYDSTFKYAPYWRYLPEILFRAPLQYIARMMSNPTIQCFTPLLITLIMFIALFVIRNRMTEQLKYQIAVSNIVIAISPYLMSQYHYVRYYWFVMASTYICIMVLAVRLKKQLTLTTVLIDIAISAIPFLFHECGGALIVTTICIEFIRLIVAFIRKDIKINFTSKTVCIAILSIVVCMYMSYRIVGRLWSILINKGFEIAFHSEAVVRYVKNVFFFGDKKLCTVAVLCVVLLIPVLVVKEENISINIEKYCLIFFIIMCVAFCAFGDVFSDAMRYYIPSYVVLALYISSGCIGVLNCIRDSLLQRTNTRYSILIQCFSCIIFMALLIPWCTYFRDDGMLFVTRQEIDEISNLISDNPDRKITIMAGHPEFLEYTGNVENVFLYRDMRASDDGRGMDEYYEVDGLTYERGWFPICGTEETMKGCLAHMQDEDYIVLLAIDPYRCNDYMRDVANRTNAIKGMSILTKSEFEKDYFYGKSQ